MTDEEIRLRDSFAAAALTGRLAHIHGPKCVNRGSGDPDDSCSVGAMPPAFYAAIWADATAMLAARGTVTPEPIMYSEAYTYNSNLTPPPASGGVRTDTAAAIDTTRAFVHNMTSDGHDIGPVLVAIAVGSELRLTDVANVGRFVAFTVAGPAIDMGAYVDVPISFATTGGAAMQGQNLPVVLRFSSVP